MPVIKARDAQTKIAQAEVLRFQDVEAEARRVLSSARQQAEALLADARVQAQRLRAEAHKAALEAGRVEGIQSGAELGRKQAMDQAQAVFVAEHASLAKALAVALEQFETRRRGLLAEMERDVIALAGAIAHRVTKRAVEIDPACVAGNVREALQLVAHKNRLEIRLHPEDLEQARQFAQELLPAQEFEAVGFVPDEMVGRGGVLLRTAGGQVDATIQTQWTRVLDEILAGWQEHWLLSPALLAPSQPAAETVEEIEPSFVEFVQQDAMPSEFSSVVEVVSAEEADVEVGSTVESLPEDAAARQVLIDEALAAAMRTVAPPRSGESTAAETAAEGPVVEEIDPSEVEEIDPNDAA